MPDVVAAPQNEPQKLLPHQSRWLAAVACYAHRWPREEAVVALFADFMREHADAAARTRTDAHLTGSAWLVDRTGTRVLLTHHRKLGRWLQLGGHADGDADLAAVALREAEEESGLGGLTVAPDLFDLDRHRIPERGGEAAHWHYDARFVVQATRDETVVVGDESNALAWRSIAALADDASADVSLTRMARKWLARRASPARAPDA